MMKAKNRSIFVSGIFIMVIAIFASALISGCTVRNTGDSGKISIVCTIFPQYDFVRELTKGCDNVEIKLLLKAGQESHDYDPSSKDIMAIHDSDVFIYVGGESDSWIDNVLETVDKSDKKILALMDMVDLQLEHDDAIEDKNVHAHDDEYDEHVWTSIANAITITKKLADELTDIEGVDKEKVEQNRDEYTAKLSELDRELRSVVAQSKIKTIVVADRFPFKYMCEEYGIKYYGAFAGCATSVEPSTSMLFRMSGRVKELKLPYIFKIEMSAGSTAKHIAEETGAGILLLHSCHNLSAAEWKAGESYCSLMKKNIENLKMAL